jgi:hypothetical protein
VSVFVCARRISRMSCADMALITIVTEALVTSHMAGGKESR